MYCILYMYIISIQLHYDTPYYVVHVYKVLVGNFAHFRQESQRQRSSQEVSWFMVVHLGYVHVHQTMLTACGKF